VGRDREVVIVVDGDFCVPRQKVARAGVWPLETCEGYNAVVHSHPVGGPYRFSGLTASSSTLTTM